MIDFPSSIRIEFADAWDSATTNAEKSAKWGLVRYFVDCTTRVNFYDDQGDLLRILVAFARSVFFAMVPVYRKALRADRAYANAVRNELIPAVVQAIPRLLARERLSYGGPLKDMQGVQSHIAKQLESDFKIDPLPPEDDLVQTIMARPGPFSYATAEQVLKVGDRQIRNLVELGKLCAVGGGKSKKITKDSLLHYAGLSTPSLSSRRPAGK